MFTRMPYRPQTFPGFKYDVRVDSLTGADVLVVACHSCSHLYRVAPHHLYERFPAYTRILDLQKRWMICRRCGAKGERNLTWHVQRAFPPCREV